MWYFLLIALVLLLIFAVWLVAGFLHFWIIFLTNIILIILIALKSKAELHEREFVVRYKTGAIIGIILTLIVYFFNISLPFYLITTFMVTTFLAVKGMEIAEWHNKKNPNNSMKLFYEKLIKM
jgi:hypothetical protein|tara:strand:- start:3932 stop:4300 length:369 start_codon:yes stop_codon:yes gene_type:complete